MDKPSNLPREPQVRTIDSAELFSQGREVMIRHQGEHYRLRLTRNQKLILTK